MQKNSSKKILKIGYARVSTEDTQDLSLENQIEMLKKAGCHKIYFEKGSGRNDNRPQFQKTIEYLKRKTHTADAELYLVVFKNDRLSRRFRTLVNTVEDIMELGIRYISLIDHIDTSTIGGKMFFQILSSFNEYEVENTRERVKIGIEKARRDGKQLGRPKISAHTRKQVVHLYRSKEYTVSNIAEQLNISKKSLYNILHDEKVSLRRK